MTRMGWLIRRTLSRMKWTQQRFADRIGVSLSLVQYWLVGRNKPTLLRLRQISKVLKIRQKDLLK